MSSLWSTPVFLKLAQELHRSGIKFPIGPGIKVARGFADLGAEEFIVMPGKKLVSLFTGEKSSMPDDFEDHFFVVPNFESLIEAFHLYHLTIPLVELSDDGSWLVDGSKVESAEEAMMSILIKSVETDSVIEQPKAKLIAV